MGEVEAQKGSVRDQALAVSRQGSWGVQHGVRQVN